MTGTTPQGAHTDSWFRLIVEGAPTAMLMVDAERRITLVNQGAEDLFGYTRDELLDSLIEVLLPERFAGQHPELVESFFACPRSRAMGAGRELFAKRKDGSEVAVEIGLSPLDTPDGKFTLATITDITERRRAEAKFRLVVEAAPNAMVLADSKGKITLVNRRTEDLFGYARSELIGQPLETLVPTRYRERHPELVSEFLKQPQARAMGAGRDLFGQRKDGSEFPIEIGLNPFESEEGTFTLAAIIDITTRKNKDDELMRSNAELEQFAYVASHDLQEPLRMVATYTELLAKRYSGQLDDKADRYIHYAVDGARRMQQLVSDVLAYSRVGSQGKPLVLVDSGKVCRRVLAVLGVSVVEAQADVVVGELPVVWADEGQLEQLFQNLLGNALKFRSEEPRIEVSAERVAGEWLFRVADNGIGIDPQFASRVFQMFQRLHGRERYSGSGIGLSIAKRIVERHGGNIWLDSSVAQGTTFCFTLQAAPLAEEK
ncbi:MAG: PAS domain S-box protein [Polyangiaceae bacterium]|nr:PAS domain S-box protein [Polyangiaceae bacterium]MCB9605632.1 PAS domain S-box protein [Polyangiaceae bacterium]